jgi:signal recognition particle subunit SRP19
MAPQIEDVDEFDDDTDIPLPSRPLPNTGTRGAILEEIGAPSGSDNEMDFGPTASGSGNASSTSRAFAKNPMQPNQQRFTGDKSAYKTYVP